ncbi:hypothetical protein C1701_15870 [Actinoalloteichus sp. AHMU CJ021]|nr:hypothetical protein C1701_15870 [Actinoalloteichus sp. AHMU CJ021]
MGSAGGFRLLLPCPGAHRRVAHRHDRAERVGGQSARDRAPRVVEGFLPQRALEHVRHAAGGGGPGRRRRVLVQPVPHRGAGWRWRPRSRMGRGHRVR